MSFKLKELFDSREEVIFWVFLFLAVGAVPLEYASFLEASAFAVTAYGLLLTKNHLKDKKVND